MPKKGKAKTADKLARRDAKRLGGEAEHSGAAVLVARLAIGLMVLFGVLTSGAVDWVWEWLASIPLSSIRSASARVVGEWAPERLADRGVDLLAAHPSPTTVLFDIVSSQDTTTLAAQTGYTIRAESSVIFSSVALSGGTTSELITGTTPPETPPTARRHLLTMAPTAAPTSAPTGAEVSLNASGTDVQWAYTTGNNDGVHYDLAQPLGLTAPTGYTVVLKNTGENIEYDTG